MCLSAVRYGFYGCSCLFSLYCMWLLLCLFAVCVCFVLRHSFNNVRCLLRFPLAVIVPVFFCWARVCLLFSTHLKCVFECSLISLSVDFVVVVVLCVSFCCPKFNECVWRCVLVRVYALFECCVCLFCVFLLLCIKLMGVVCCCVCLCVCVSFPGRVRFVCCCLVANVIG